MMLVALPCSDHPQTLLCRTSLHSCCEIHKNKHHEKAIKPGLSLETWLYHLLSDTENRQYETEDGQLTDPLYMATEHSSPAHLIMVIHECPYSKFATILMPSCDDGHWKLLEAETPYLPLNNSVETRLLYVDYEHGCHF